MTVNPRFHTASSVSNAPNDVSLTGDGTIKFSLLNLRKQNEMVEAFRHASTISAHNIYGLAGQEPNVTLKPTLNDAVA